MCAGGEENLSNLYRVYFPIKLRIFIQCLECKSGFVFLYCHAEEITAYIMFGGTCVMYLSTIANNAVVALVFGFHTGIFCQYENTFTVYVDWWDLPAEKDLKFAEDSWINEDLRTITRETFVDPTEEQQGPRYCKVGNAYYYYPKNKLQYIILLVDGQEFCLISDEAFDPELEIKNGVYAKLLNRSTAEAQINELTELIKKDLKKVS